MVYVLALACSLANALTSVLQRMGVETAPKDDTMRPRLMLYVIKRGIWLAGFALMIASFLLQAVALHLGRITVVQPILTTELVFLVIILGTWFRFTVGWRELVGAAAAGLGLAGFLVFSAPSGGNVHPSPGEWLFTGGSCTVAIAIGIVLARRGPRWWRAAMFGTTAAIAYAFTAGLTKVTADYASADWATLYQHWEPYALAFFGVLAVFLTQNAFLAGPIAASQSTIVLVDPLVSIFLGVFLFGDDLRTAMPWGPLEAISLVVLFGGALLLCQSPLVTGVKGESGEHDLLLHRHHARKAVDGGGDPSIQLDPGA